MACCDDCGELGVTPQDVVRQCESQLHIPPELCQQLFQVAGGDIGIYYILIRAALIKGGTAACTTALADVGVPIVVGAPACKWAVEKLVKAWLETLPKMGAPTFYSLYAKGVEGIHWRRCDSPSNLMPGEHFRQASGGLPNRCLLNIAILQKEGIPLSIVYIPCEWLRAGGATKSICRDRDGAVRESGIRSPLYAAGFYGKRLSDAWPDQFEQEPWDSPRERIRAMLPTFAPATDIFLFEYPAGSMAIFDPNIEQYRILKATTGNS